MSVMTFADSRTIYRPETLKHRLSALLNIDVADDAETLKKYSRDTSIFERTPSLVVYPKDADEVSAVVRCVHDAKKRGNNVSIAARSSGTDMSGGPLTDSISMVFTKYMDHIGKIETDLAEAEPGVYYRDFEKATIAHHGQLLPSFPASREICAIGGMIANNSGGELTLEYGKTNHYVRKLDVVLSDGSRATLHTLSENELKEKEAQQNLEGSIYRGIHELIQKNADEIELARPTVTKNSAGYALLNVYDKEQKTFDLTQLISGSQGTLALVTKAKLGLVHKKPHRAMLVIFLSDIDILPEVVHRVLKHDPESFESYDDQTFKLAVRFIPQIIGHFGIMQMIKLGLAFIPEVLMVIFGGVPKLVLMAEFSADTHDEALFQAEAAEKALHGLAVSTRIAKSETQAANNSTTPRGSFALLRKNLKGLYASPFIDDIV